MRASYSGKIARNTYQNRRRHDAAAKAEGQKRMVDFLRNDSGARFIFLRFSYDMCRLTSKTPGL